MKNNTTMLSSIRALGKLYAKCLEPIRVKYELSQIEVTIISFLHNNPEKDTAADIVTYRMLPKGNVSQGVESLIKKKLLLRASDERDRRKIHLSLTKSAVPIVREVSHANNQFEQLIFEDFTEEEKILYEKMSKRLIKSANLALERK